jgi:hypothetical protein
MAPYVSVCFCEHVYSASSKTFAFSFGIDILIFKTLLIMEIAHFINRVTDPYGYQIITAGFHSSTTFHPLL